MSDVGSGHIVNLASNDVHRFDLVSSIITVLYNIFFVNVCFRHLSSFTSCG